MKDKAIVPDKYLLWFVCEMERVLQENDHKGGWGTMENAEILERIDEEVAELKQVCSCNIRRNEHRRRLIKEAVDIANFCYFIAENNKPEK